MRRKTPTALPVNRLALLLSGLVLLLGLPGPARAADSDYARELTHLEQELADAEPGRRLHLLYTRATLTGDLDDLEQVARLATEAHTSSAADEPLLFLATASLELHRLAEAEAALDRLGHSATAHYPRQLRADIALQRGRYEAAQAVYSAQLEEERTWDRLARVAYLERRNGRYKQADRLYGEAQETLTAKEMRRYAWLELQRGLIDLDRDEPADALGHFHRADRAYSGYWLIEEHIAEALVQLGRTAEAETLYRRVVATTEHPEYIAALADLLATRDPRESQALERRAAQLLEEHFARFPEAVAGHYADRLLDQDPQHPRLLELAELDYRLRPNPDSALRLAKVCLARGDTARARELADVVAAAPWRPRQLRELRRNLRTLSAP